VTACEKRTKICWETLHFDEVFTNRLDRRCLIECAQPPYPLVRGSIDGIRCPEGHSTQVHGYKGLTAMAKRVVGMFVCVYRWDRRRRMIEVRSCWGDAITSVRDGGLEKTNEIRSQHEPGEEYRETNSREVDKNLRESRRG
jgi:hypothetical protein